MIFIPYFSLQQISWTSAIRTCAAYSNRHREGNSLFMFFSVVKAFVHILVSSITDDGNHHHHQHHAHKENLLKE